MKLEEIGFYSLSDERARTASPTSAMQRCEVLITGKCDFKAITVVGLVMMLETIFPWRR